MHWPRNQEWVVSSRSFGAWTPVQMIVFNASIWLSCGICWGCAEASFYARNNFDIINLVPMFYLKPCSPNKRSFKGSGGVVGGLDLRRQATTCARDCSLSWPPVASRCMHSALYFPNKRSFRRPGVVGAWCFLVFLPMALYWLSSFSGMAV